jgi:hypothetical protein
MIHGFIAGAIILLFTKVMFRSWVLEGKREEGKTCEEINLCLGVLKNKERFWGILDDLFYPILKFPQMGGGLDG